MDGGDDRHLAVVHRGEGLPAPPVDADQRGVGGVGRELLDVDTRLIALDVGVRGHDEGPHPWVAPVGPDGLGEPVPAGDRERVHRRVVDDHLGHVVPHDGSDHERSVANVSDPGSMEDSRPACADQ